jgi:DUF4097 and DUF4098 domain-containing protein YvlB
MSTRILSLVLSMPSAWRFLSICLLIDTGSGGVTVRVPASLGAQVELDTGAGGIDVDVALEVREVRRNYMLGTLGDGDGRIRIDTGSGGIRLISG